MIKYLMNDGAVITAPDDSTEAFWASLRDSSKFDSEATIEQYRLNFIGRWEVASGQKWHENYVGDDLEHLTWLGIIKWSD